jgi:hypothetical protein
MRHAIIVAGLLSALFATSALAAGDTFDRTVLGNRWVATAGSLAISGNLFVGSDGSLGYDRKSVADTTVKAIVYLPGTGLRYGAVASGYIAGGNNAFVKIQSQDGTGQFDHAAFYTGNNGGGSFFTLNSPVASPATLTVSFCGTVATMTIKGGSRTQVYTYDYGTSFGAGAGLGTYGSVALDNFKATTGGCAMAQRGKKITGSNAQDRSLLK